MFQSFDFFPQIFSFGRVDRAQGELGGLHSRAGGFHRGSSARKRLITRRGGLFSIFHVSPLAHKEREESEAHANHDSKGLNQKENLSGTGIAETESADQDNEEGRVVNAEGDCLYAIFRESV